MNACFASWGVARSETMGCIGVGLYYCVSEVFGSAVGMVRDGFSASTGRM